MRYSIRSEYPNLLKVGLLRVGLHGSSGLWQYISHRGQGEMRGRNSLSVIDWRPASAIVVRFNVIGWLGELSWSELSGGCVGWRMNWPRIYTHYAHDESGIIRNSKLRDGPRHELVDMTTKEYVIS